MKKILFLHGALGSAQEMMPFVDALSDNYICEAIDFPLHGNNASISDFTIEAFTDYLIYYIRQNYTEPVSIFGYSLGGYVALYAAAKEPQLFDKILTLGTKFEWDKSFVELQMQNLEADAMKAKTPHFVVSLSAMHQHIKWRKMLEETIHLMVHLAKKPNLTPEILQKISTEVLLGVGDKDSMVSMEETRKVYRYISFSSMFVLPRSSHPLERTNVSVLLAICRDFFKN